MHKFLLLTALVLYLENKNCFASRILTEPQCEKSSLLEVCYKNSSDILNESQTMTGFLPSAEFMDRHCPTILDGMNCTSDYFNDCFSSLTNNVNMTKFVGIVTQACDKESDLGKGYRKHVNCINGIQDKFEAGLERISRFESGFRLYVIYRIGNYNDEDKQLCVLGDLYATELESVIGGHCGEDAKIMARAMLSLAREACPANTDYEDYHELLVNYILSLPNNDEHGRVKRYLRPIIPYGGGDDYRNYHHYRRHPYYYYHYYNNDNDDDESLNSERSDSYGEEEEDENDKEDYTGKDCDDVDETDDSNDIDDSDGNDSEDTDDSEKTDSDERDDDNDSNEDDDDNEEYDDFGDRRITDDYE